MYVTENFIRIDTLLSTVKKVKLFVTLLNLKDSLPRIGPHVQSTKGNISIHKIKYVHFSKILSKSHRPLSSRDLDLDLKHTRVRRIWCNDYLFF